MSRHRHVQGRHRAPSTAGQTAARVAAAGAVGVLPAAFVPAAQAEPADGWGPIIQCESGNQNINNSTYPKSSASGYFQIIDGTWAANGGLQFAPRAIQASRAEQEIVANRIHARAGSLRDWYASRACWGDEIGSEAPVRGGTARPAPAPKANRPAPAGSYSYTCTRAELKYEECDPHLLGQVVTDTNGGPRHGSAPQTSPARGVAPRPAAGDTYVVASGDTLAKIAAAHGTTWRAIFNANRDVVDDPNRIYVGEQLDLP